MACNKTQKNGALALRQAYLDSVLATVKEPQALLAEVQESDKEMADECFPLFVSESRILLMTDSYLALNVRQEAGKERSWGAPSWGETWWRALRRGSSGTM
jgi:hypothetical protein